ncbi:hypothetical protein [Haloferula sp. BvORR071]|uniref:hypothetical protein n=1 Tax=Haloferula sp. BvORR071 TaxID=1396141 RepID=UPI000552C40D|nr:hypothetical protein [Haloferula sp. BvORR071]
MNPASQDTLKLEFLALWNHLAGAGTPPLAIAGGYGLLLKQEMLLERGGQGILIPLERWSQAAPRTTKDLDFVIDLAFIRNAADQKSMVDALDACGFKVTARNPRWQFEKSAGGGSVVIEFHAVTPPEGEAELSFKDHRIKHKPSLGSDGIHARHNHEAGGCELHPQTLDVDGIGIQIPNAVTWCVMKLTAMADRHQRSGRSDLTEEQRRYSRSQAEKHAVDVCRIVAMSSRDEGRQAMEVKAKLEGSTVFSLARQIAHEYFADEDSWGAVVIERFWSMEDRRAIRTLLAIWFQPG